ncbi:MAG: helix-turn-helix domain-containing protein [Egibacteraceae bacterium]
MKWGRIVLLSAQVLTGGEVAVRVGCSEQTVVAWCNRYAAEGWPRCDDVGSELRP